MKTQSYIPKNLLKKITSLLLVSLSFCALHANEVLYNGIELPEDWPPSQLDPESTRPMPVPYLKKPPKVIPIDVGRQLFVDDFLIEKTNLTLTYHQAEKFSGNPVFVAETAEEIRRNEVVYLGQGGVFYDPEESHFKLFYTAGWRGGLAMATSKDLIHWTRPDLGKGNGNQLLPADTAWHGPLSPVAGGDNAVWFDIDETDASQKIKYMACWTHAPKDKQPEGFTHSLQVSDGTNWSRAIRTGIAADYCSFYYNPFGKTWIYSIKQGGPRGRSRYYSEHPYFLPGANWSNSVYWTNADRLDKPEPEGAYPGAGEVPQLYSLAGIAYESIMIGMHQIHRGPNNAICDEGNFPKLTDLEVGFSRDGFHWDRPDRRGFIRGERTEGAWDRAYVHTTTGVFVVVGDKLVFPYCAYSGTAADGRKGMYTGGRIGLATLRRDGFASMNAESKTGTLTTRPVSFSGKHLFVNTDTADGVLRVAVLDKRGRAIEPFTLESCRPVSTDGTLVQIHWNGVSDLSSLKDQPVRFQFELTNGSLYSFWVSRDASGRSDGYVAAGGPGYPGTVDTVGAKALSQIDSSYHNLLRNP